VNPRQIIRIYQIAPTNRASHSANPPNDADLRRANGERRSAGLGEGPPDCYIPIHLAETNPTAS